MKFTLRHFHKLHRTFTLRTLLGLTGAMLAGQGAWAQGQLEAENAQLVNCNARTRNGVTYAENLTQTGASVVFTLPAATVPTTGFYTVAARYATARDYVSSMSVYVNGTDVTQAQFPSTGSWDSWNTQRTTLYLLAGSPNTISYTYDADDSGWINLDYIQFAPALSPGFQAGAATAAELPAEISVDKFTGTAGVSIPLCTVTMPGITLPVALSYQAGGVQVDDPGGEVGLNWSLQAAPSIRRQVRDLPDDLKLENSRENRYGWLQYPASAPTSKPTPPAAVGSCPASSAEQLAWSQLNSYGSLTRSGSGQVSIYDTEPDVFTYEIPGYSGKFLFDASKTVRLLPAAPVTIQPVFYYGEIDGFTIRTPEGTVYRFNEKERIAQAAGNSAPVYMVRDFYDVAVWSAQGQAGQPDSRSFIQLNTKWFASSITTAATAQNPTGRTISFEYFHQDNSDWINSFSTSGNSYSFWLGSAAPTSLNGGFGLSTSVRTSPLLVRINAPTATVTFSRVTYQNDTHPLSPEDVVTSLVQSVAVTSPLEGDALVKRYDFDYSNITSDFAAGQRWYTSSGTICTSKDESSRTFLRRIRLARGTSSLVAYAFDYEQLPVQNPALPLADPSINLPPFKSVNKDYWGFANGNNARTAAPQLYAYPQLVSNSPATPGAPYRLYPVPAGITAYQANSFILGGADRRPARDLRIALAGTLTGVTFATGGKVRFEYEQHQFYDPVAQQSYPAGGLRIRTLRQQDPLTQVETRRDYWYVDAGAAAGRSSGVLLHLPRLAFANPVDGSGSWATASVRSNIDLAPDPFESRSIGYRRVTEQVPGKGQVVTEFAVPAGADDVRYTPVDATSGLPAWQRPVFGVARPASPYPCPSVAPLQAVAELYPFVPPMNYDFCRGRATRISYLSEPASSTAGGSLLRQEDFSYRYTGSQTPGATGLRYQQLGATTAPFYVYATYPILTDYLYTLQQQTVLQKAPGAADNQTKTTYAYNSSGWLVNKTTVGSDNTILRTRYKYLGDYQTFGPSPPGSLANIYVRKNIEGISSDVVETISEVRPAGQSGPVQYAGATLQTFATNQAVDVSNNTATTTTYPYQVWRGLPAQPVDRTSILYDSTYVDSKSGQLHLSSFLRLVSTVPATDQNLTPITTRDEANRQVSGQHLGFAGSLPVLRIMNAAAAEVVFSDFESAKSYQFTTTSGLNPSPAAARTGNGGLAMASSQTVSSTLPTSAAPQYRLVFWTKSAAATSCTVAIAAGSSPAVYTQSVPVAGTGQWVRTELLVPLGTISSSDRKNYQLTLTAGGALQLDDVLLLPATARAASTTYTLALGKTSETDARGRTTYYEYDSNGDLTLVRDQSRSILHQYQKVLPGRTVVSPVTFSMAGDMLENSEQSFTISNSLPGISSYQWDFGDKSAGFTPSPTTALTAKHTFPSFGYDQSYVVRLSVTNQGRTYVIINTVYIHMRPLVLTTCLAGVVALDNCPKPAGKTIDTSCYSTTAVDQTKYTSYSISVNLPGAFIYKWEFFDTTLPDSGWQTYQPDPNQPSPNQSVINLPAATSYIVRCRVSNDYQEVVSDVMQVARYDSCPN